MDGCNRVSARKPNLGVLCDDENDGGRVVAVMVTWCGGYNGWNIFQGTSQIEVSAESQLDKTKLL